MPGLLYNGIAQPVDGVEVVNYLDDKDWTLPIPKCGTYRRKLPQCVILHTTGGYPDRDHPTPQRIRSEAAQPKHCRAASTLSYWRNSSRIAGAHILIDADGTCYVLTDLTDMATYHVPDWNHLSIGIEVVQQSDSSLFEAQLGTVGAVVDALVTKLSLPRVATGAYAGVRPDVTGVGVVGHRDLTSSRGFGDPGDFVMAAAVRRGQWRVV